MSTKIHHNTVKRAARLGLTIETIENEFVVKQGDATLASHASASVALDRAVGKLGGAEADPMERLAKATAAIRDAGKPLKAPKPRRDYNEAELLEDDEPESNSIIKPVYKARYKPHKMTCGDALVQQLAMHLKYTTEDGEVRVDAGKLKHFAQANGCWDPKYANLNIGMRKMNVSNRLRAKIRKGHVVVWS